MASIIEAFDSTVKEPFSGIKIILWAIPLSIAVTSKAWWVSSLLIPVLVLFLTGFIIELGNNVITKKGVIVPGIGFKSMFISGLIGLLGLGPYIIIAVLGVIGINLFTLPWPVWDQTLKIILLLFLFSFPLTALAILIRRKNILEVFNPMKMWQGFLEMFLSFPFFIMKMMVWTVLIIGFLYLLFSMFIGFNNDFWNYLITMYAFAIVLISANIVAQVSEEVYLFKESEEEKKRERNIIANLK